MKLHRRGFLAAFVTAFVPIPEARLVDTPARLMKGIPQEVCRIIEKSFLENCFHDALFPELLKKS